MNHSPQHPRAICRPRQKDGLIRVGQQPRAFSCACKKILRKARPDDRHLIQLRSDPEDYL
jgi:hypothetical protein